MREALSLSLNRVSPTDSHFRETVLQRLENETLEAHLERILEALYIEIVADKQIIAEGLDRCDIVVANHPTALDILFVGSLLGNRDYTVVTQHKRVLALKRLFGEETIYPVPLDKGTAKDFLTLLKKHISSKRKLVLFPSGGTEIKGGDGVWHPFYNKLFESEVLRGKSVLPLAISAEAGGIVQQQIGDTQKGREIFPELHYTMPARKISVPITSGEIFVSGKNAESEYRKTFNP